MRHGTITENKYRKRGEKSPLLLARGRRSTRTATGSKVYRGFNFTFSQPMRARRLQTEPRAAGRPLTPCSPAGPAAGAARPAAHRRERAEAEAESEDGPLLPFPSSNVRSGAPSRLLQVERFSMERKRNRSCAEAVRQ